MAIVQKSKPKNVDQVLYNGRYFDRATFRTFVYNFEGRKLAESYDEYEQLIASGLWYADPCKVLGPNLANKPETKLKQVKNDSTNG